MSPLREEAAHPASYLDGRLTDRIFIHHRDRLLRVFLRDIHYIEAQRAYCRLVTTSATYTLSISLGALERQLTGSGLLRVHRSYLVNLCWVEAVADHCLVIGTTSIPVARAQRTELDRHLRFIH
ncbi:hypothetical protein LEM8419_02357 [Neolewinella maritima]|uniref:HTH LytTR-type domain-containing protein n=1 Tax=Neolewinella maritima TaxID=1383882 RepID=A0ABM9B2A8_9BACT|nr:LytTR family DNA-binding domain-containing protein [Neolewinella maritima]CAH1001454.1 hypothetical protein LEM8419_02357 [Neolewinella maritima]